MDGGFSKCRVFGEPFLAMLSGNHSPTENGPVERLRETTATSFFTAVHTAVCQA